MEKYRGNEVVALALAFATLLAADCLTGCGDTRDKVATILNDTENRNVDLEFEGGDVVERVPYSVVNLIPNVDTDKFEEHKEIPVFIDEEQAEPVREVKNEGVYMTPQFYCDTALPAVNWYTNNFRPLEPCIQDESHCEEVDCEGELTLN